MKRKISKFQFEIILFLEILSHDFDSNLEIELSRYLKCNLFK